MNWKNVPKMTIILLKNSARKMTFLKMTSQWANINIQSKMTMLTKNGHLHFEFAQVDFIDPAEIQWKSRINRTKFSITRLSFKASCNCSSSSPALLGWKFCTTAAEGGMVLLDALTVSVERREAPAGTENAFKIKLKHIRINMTTPWLMLNTCGF